jgi:chromosome segregation ATPase
MPLDELSEMRRKQLRENIRESYTLLQEYEDALHLASDPKERTRYRREMERLREEVARYKEELATLEKGEPAAPTSQPQPAGRIINTGGGTYIEGDVHTGGGTFVGGRQEGGGVGRETPTSTIPSTEQERQERIASLLRQRNKARRNINRLEEMRLSYGANVPLDILNQLDDAREELERIEQELEDLGGLG